MMDLFSYIGMFVVGWYVGALIVVWMLRWLGVR